MSVIKLTRKVILCYCDNVHCCDIHDEFPHVDAVNTLKYVPRLYELMPVDGVYCITHTAGRFMHNTHQSEAVIH